MYTNMRFTKNIYLAVLRISQKCSHSQNPCLALLNHLSRVGFESSSSGKGLLWKQLIQFLASFENYLVLISNFNLVCVDLLSKPAQYQISFSEPTKLPLTGILNQITFFQKHLIICPQSNKKEKRNTPDKLFPKRSSFSHGYYIAQSGTRQNLLVSLESVTTSNMCTRIYIHTQMHCLSTCTRDLTFLLIDSGDLRCTGQLIFVYLLWKVTFLY